MTPTMQELEKELGADPKLRRFYELAREYQKVGRLDEAAALCERGLALQPTRWQARILLAQVYLAKDRLNEARFQVERVLLPLPDNVPANHLAADIYFALGEKEAALKHYRVVELFEPGRTGVAERIAAIAGEDEVPPQAEAAVEEAPMPEEEAQEAAPPPVPLLAELPPAPLSPLLEPPPEELAQEEPAVDTAEMTGELPEAAPTSDLTAAEGKAGALEPLGGGEESWDQEDASFEMEILADEGMLVGEEVPADLEVGAATAETAVISEDTSEHSIEEEIPETVDHTPSLPPFNTVTLADLYEKQGYPEKAVEVYQRILLTDPDNTSVRDKVGRLLQRMAGESPESPPVRQEDVQKALRQRRVTHLQSWLRRMREARHV